MLTLKEIHFENPPLIEVICGVSFAIPDNWSSEFARSFQQLHQEQFPLFEDKPPALNVTEIFDDNKSPVEQEQYLDSGWHRGWLLSQDKRKLIQIQPGRFLYNFKRASHLNDPFTDYPGFYKIYQEFQAYHAQFTSFLTSQDCSIQTKQYELTYVNLLSEVSQDDPKLLVEHFHRDHTWNANTAERRFLPPPAQILWNDTYLVKDSLSRLHISCGTVWDQSGQHSSIVLNLTMRGLPVAQTPPVSMEEWFHKSHKGIINAFIDITPPTLHQHWGRKI